MAPIRGEAIYGQLDDTNTTSPAEDGAGIVRITGKRALHANLRDATGAEVSIVNVTQYTEDAASPADPTAPSLVLRRRDALASEATTSGDWVVPNVTSKGELYVKQTDAVPVTDNFGSLTVDNGGTFAVQDSGAITDNNAFTNGGSKVFAAGFIIDEVAGTAISEDDAGAARMDTKRAQVGVIEDATTRGQRATVSAAGALKVDGSAVTQPVSGTVTANLAAGTNNIGDVDVLTLPNVTNAGTFSVQDSQVVADNAAFTDGTTKLFMTGYVLDDTAGTALTENDAAAPRISTNRATVGVIEDGATRARYATVKAASTAAVAADPALVVALSPNNNTQANALYVQPRQLVSYSAVYMLGSRPYALSNAFGAAGTKQYATIYHTGASTKTVRIRRIACAMESASAAAIVVALVVRLTATTAPATGNPAITPQALDLADNGTAAEAACLALPTTAGTMVVSTPVGIAEWNLGITGAASTANPPPPVQWVDVFRADPSTALKPLSMRAGTAEGWALLVDCSAAATIKGYVVVEFTEE